MPSDDNLAGILLVLVATIVLLPLLVMGFMMPMMGMWGGGHMWNGGMWDGTGVSWAWILLWLVFLVIVVGLGYLLYRLTSGTIGDRTDPAIEELRLAYARGELSEEEFEQRRRRLE